MMANVLVRLTEPGQPLDRFFDTITGEFDKWGSSLRWDDVLVHLVACFLIAQYEEEQALTDVTRDSIKTFALEFLTTRFHSGLEESQYEDLATRIVSLTVEGIERSRVSFPPESSSPGTPKSS